MMPRSIRTYALPAAFAWLALGCDNESDREALREEAILATKDYVTSELQKLVDASEKLQKAAPAPDADGWNKQADAEAVADMRAAWNDARDAYERVEGSIAILFGELDVSTDERYDGFIESEADDNLFDGEGVTGMHAIERILWAGEHPEHVIAFEKALEHYKEASFPKTMAEARDFKEKLAKRLVDDVQTMHDEFEPLGIEASTAFFGMLGSMEEQLEKVTLATTAQDESRYAQRTLDDMRANLEGGEAVYAAFQDWVREDAGDAIDRKIRMGFDRIEAAYAANEGPAIPPPPDSFDETDPSEADLATPFGKLWKLLNDETDLESDDSMISLMRRAAGEMELEEVE